MQPERPRVRGTAAVAASEAGAQPAVPLAAPGEVQTLTERVERIVAPNADMFTGPGTNTYLVGGPKGPRLVVDPGPDDSVHIDAVRRAVGGRDVVGVVVTHHHPDHAPAARALADGYGAPVFGYAPTGGFTPDKRLVDGAVVVAGNARLRAVHTPGHASDHLCLLMQAEGSLFTGDHVMAGSTVVISPPDGDMGAYLASLERLLRLDLRWLYPGHGPVIEHPEAYVAAYLAHRRMREDQVLDALAAGCDTVSDVVARVYVDVAEVLHPVAAHSVLAHLLLLQEKGRAASAGDGGPDGTWRLLE